eukprot:scaffold569_cov408-Prasinococcus_capsulatus_cf.AAC.40
MPLKFRSASWEDTFLTRAYEEALAAYKAAHKYPTVQDDGGSEPQKPTLERVEEQLLPNRLASEEDVDEEGRHSSASTPRSGEVIFVRGRTDVDELVGPEALLDDEEEAEELEADTAEVHQPIRGARLSNARASEGQADCSAGSRSADPGYRRTEPPPQRPTPPGKRALKKEPERDPELPDWASSREEWVRAWREYYEQQQNTNWGGYVHSPVGGGSMPYAYHQGSSPWNNPTPPYHPHDYDPYRHSPGHFFQSPHHTQMYPYPYQYPHHYHPQTPFTGYEGWGTPERWPIGAGDSAVHRGRHVQYGDPRSVDPQGPINTGFADRGGTQLKAADSAAYARTLEDAFGGLGLTGDVPPLPPIPLPQDMDEAKMVLSWYYAGFFTGACVGRK